MNGISASRNAIYHCVLGYGLMIQTSTWEAIASEILQCLIHLNYCKVLMKIVHNLSYIPVNEIKVHLQEKYSTLSSQKFRVMSYRSKSSNELLEGRIS